MDITIALTDQDIWAINQQIKQQNSVDDIPTFLGKQLRQQLDGVYAQQRDIFKQNTLQTFALAPDITKAQILTTLGITDPPPK